LITRILLLSPSSLLLDHAQVDGGQELVAVVAGWRATGPAWPGRDAAGAGQPTIQVGVGEAADRQPVQVATSSKTVTAPHDDALISHHSYGTRPARLRQRYGQPLREEGRRRALLVLESSRIGWQDRSAGSLLAAGC
jgi:hypothetical protein